MNREFLKKKKYLILLLVLILGIAANKFISAEDGPSLRDPLAVSVARARVQDKPSMVPVTGSIEGLTSNIISSRFNGKVTNVMVEDGQYVHKGQVLFIIDMEELNDSLQMAESSLSQLQAKYEKAYADYMRYEMLHSTGAISVQQLESARTTLLSAQSDVATASAQVNSARKKVSDATVVSPVDGVVANKTAEFIQTATGTSFDIDDEEEVIDMCRAWKKLNGPG